MTNPISSLPQQFVAPDVSLPEFTNSSDQAGFLDTFQKAMGQVQQAQNEADSQVASLLSGDGQDVHSAMIAVEKANLTFELMVQVRNKIVQAYQDVSRMQF
jgi:flagellar hook-basal body complex protein FliE